MESFSHTMVPPILVAAVVLVAVKWVRRYRTGQPLPLVPASAVARAVALVVAALVVGAGAATSQPWTAIVPAIALGGIAGAAVERVHRGSPR
ncbi:hypothetical protein ACIGXM_03525 [Kitasatospora sp. NPDC052896]|uniref:hypothetical protein n=1 Tax=Kitasatospora sp. NPDC052896 TaxID=3364061 RepID=UPI0037CB92EC